MREYVPLSGTPTRQEERTHRGGLPHADGGDWTPDVVHGVVNGHAGGNGAAGRVYIQRDRLRGVVGFEEEELRGDRGGHGVVDLTVEANDAFGEQAREDVRGFPAAGLVF